MRMGLLSSAFGAALLCGLPACAGATAPPPAVSLEPSPVVAAGDADAGALQMAGYGDCLVDVSNQLGQVLHEVPGNLLSWYVCLASLAHPG